MFLRLIFAMTLFYVAIAENMRGAKENLDIADIQQGDILNAMERFTRAISKGTNGLKLPDNFKKADGSFISIPHTVKLINEAEEKRKLAAPTVPTACDGAGASAVETKKVGDKTLKFNFVTDPKLTPVPTDVAGITSMVTSVGTTLAKGTGSVCMYLDVDVGQQGLNWDFTNNAVQTASIDLAGGTNFIKATCDNCYAKMGGALTYKTDCSIDVTNPTASTCTVNLYVGGGVAFDLTMSVSELNFADNEAQSTIYTGTKTQVFYDPQTTISVSLTPTLKAAFSGTAKSTGALTVKTSMDSQVSVGATCSLSGSAFSLDVGYVGDIALNEPTITSNLQMDTYDLTISVTPDLMWTIGAGQMATANFLSLDYSNKNVAATGMAVVMDVPNPMTFSWNFAKKSASDITSKASATVGFLVKNLNTYLALNYYYDGSKATLTDNAPLYDYSKWPASKVGSTSYLEYDWALYTAPTSTKPTTATLGTAKSGTLSLTGTAPAPSPSPGPAPTGPTAPTAPTSPASKGDAKSGMSGGAIAGLVIGLLVAAALAYYVFTQYTAKAPEANTGLDVKVEVTPTA